MENHILRNHRLRLTIFALLVLAVMVIIFFMSARTGDESAKMSSKFAQGFLGQLLSRLLPQLTDNVITSIRKYAHIFEFFCLGISSFLFFYELLWKKSRRLFLASVYAALWSFLYACSDEWHQTFVPERAGRLSDLRFDSAGFLCGIVLCALIAAGIRKIRNDAST